MVELSAGDILFEDEDLIAWNKPSGLLSHASLDPTRDNLQAAALKYLKSRDRREIYLALHHRLDRETSGVILMTKSKRANQPLQKQFQTGTLRKKYWAITAGGVNVTERQSHFHVQNYLRKKSKRDAEMIIVRSGGDFAKTEFEILKSNDLAGEKSALLVLAEPKTGRTHQIRVHLASLGLPLIADSLYGAQVNARIPHFLLHAKELQLVHPTLGTPLNIVASLPPQFETGLRILKLT